MALTKLIQRRLAFTIVGELRSCLQAQISALERYLIGGGGASSNVYRASVATSQTYLVKRQ